MNLYRFTMIYRHNIDYFGHNNFIILALIYMSKFCWLATKNKKKNYRDENKRFYFTGTDCLRNLNDPNSSLKKSSCWIRSEFRIEPIFIESSQAQTGTIWPDLFAALITTLAKEYFLVYFTSEEYCTREWTSNFDPSTATIGNRIRKTVKVDKNIEQWWAEDYVF
jgi:hypothetical protein